MRDKRPEGGAPTPGATKCPTGESVEEPFLWAVPAHLILLRHGDQTPIYKRADDESEL